MIIKIETCEDYEPSLKELNDLFIDLEEIKHSHGSIIKEIRFELKG